MTRPVEVQDRGTAAVEYAGVLPFALIIVLVAFQAFMASTTVERVSNAARTGARVAGQQQDGRACEGAALNAMPAWLNDNTVEGGKSGDDGVYCHVRAKVPLLWKGVPLDFTVDRTVTMPLG